MYGMTWLHAPVLTWMFFLVLSITCIHNARSKCFQKRKIFRNATSGTISNGVGKYSSDQRCEWLILSPNSTTHPYITLTFTRKHTECTFDYVLVYDGNDYNSKVLATLNGDSSTTSLPQVYAKSGSMLIYFFSDKDYELSGFSATFQVYTCPNNCSGHGRCLTSYTGNRCQCRNRWVGEHCSQLACPYNCNSPHGTCDLENSRNCKCSNGYIGIGCKMEKKSLLQTNTWKLVYNKSNEGIESTHLAGHAGVFVDPYLWLFGGYDMNEISGKLFRYDFVENSWLFVEVKHDKPQARRYHTVCSFEETVNGALSHKLILFGGDLGREIFSDELWIFDILRHEWILIENHLLSYLFPLAQHASAVVTMGRKKFLYVFGGRAMTSTGMKVSSNMFRFDLSSRTWEQVAASESIVKLATVELAGHSMIFDEISKTLVIFGGYHALGTAIERSNAIFLFDLDKRYWLQLSVPETPKARSFHSASIVGDYMIIFGGSVHTHHGDESCHDDGLYFYNLRCYSWHTDVLYNDLRPNGRLGHVAAATDEGLLFIHGGYNGIVRNQLFVYKVPLYAIPSASAAVQSICMKHYRSTCLMDHRCRWCITDRSCIALAHSSTCPEVNEPICEGVCKRLSTCTSCSLSSDYQMTNAYVWEKVFCGWCVPDCRCYQIDQPSPTEVCGAATSNSNEDAWWGLQNRDLLITARMCIADNVPPGLQAVFYYNNPSLTSPDEIFFIHEEFTIEDLSASPPAGTHHIQVQGYLHFPLDNGHDYRFRLYTSSNAGKFCLSTDNDEADLEVIVSASGESSQSGDTSSTVVRTLDIKRRYYYMMLSNFTQTQHSGEWKGSIHLQWIAARGEWGYQYGFSPIKSEHLEPYHSINKSCKIHSECMSCLTDFSCVWSSTKGLCLSRDCALNVASSSSCQLRNIGDVDYLEIITEPVSCPNCADRHSCSTCLAGRLCRWNSTYGCSKLNYLIEGISQASSCPRSCEDQKSCSDCLRNDVCGWCVTTKRCYTFKNHRLFNLFFECRVWMKEPRECSNCSQHLTCKGCLQEYECGWCSFPSNALLGKCTHGQYGGPSNKSECFTSSTDVAPSYYWSYDVCPDTDECTVEWPIGTRLNNCHANATCINTASSFQCLCQYGYIGDGVNCNRTCEKKCMHGICSGSPHYRCLCDLGWTGNDYSDDFDCHVDCKCNFHSLCETGIGVCDRCHLNTRGLQCDECIPGYFGNTTSSGGCQACQCHGHGNPDLGLCHPDTGVCICLHKTLGDNCQYCLPGYYGDPRNGRACYRPCVGQTILNDGNRTGAFGTWNTAVVTGDRSQEPKSVYCMWIISAGDDDVIELTIDENLDVACMYDRILVYDGIPPSTKISLATKLASICGINVKKSIVLYAFSGHLMVLYETDQYEQPSLGFNATYRLLPCNGNKHDCLSLYSAVDNTCPNNCSSSVKRGTCIRGLCRCHSNYTGVDCSLKTSELLTPVNWWLEWNAPAQSIIWENRSNADPGPLFGHTVVAVGDMIWLFGGFSNEKPESGLYRYNIFDSSWSEITISTADHPAARYLHTAVHVPLLDVMLVYGGLSKNGSSFNDLWEFSFKRRAWRKIHTDMKLPAVAGHTMTMCFESKSVIIGGYSASQHFNTKVWMYDTRNRTFSQLSGSGVSSSGIFGHSAVFDRVTGLLYVFGGLIYNYKLVSGVTPSRTLYIYNVAIERWSIVQSAERTLRYSLTQPRYFHAAVPYSYGMQRGFLVIGGQTDSEKFTDDLLLFRYDCNEWTNLNFRPRHNHDDQRKTLFHPTIGSGSAGVTIYSEADRTQPVHYVYGGNRNGILQNTLQGVRVTLTCHSNANGCGCKKNSHVRKCSELRNCHECESHMPVDYRLYCKWCGSFCNLSLTITSGACVSLNETCPSTSECHETGCGDCFESSCTACRTLPCQWKDHTQSDGQINWSCSGQRKTMPSHHHFTIGHPPLPMTTTKSKLTSSCPKQCSLEQHCTRCLSSKGGSVGGPASCWWSVELKACFSPTFSALICMSGQCGHIIRPPVGCPTSITCVGEDYCHDCVKEPLCGWQGFSDGSGRGLCVPGDFWGPADKISYMEIPTEVWWYVQCPLENECSNRHHRCSSLPPHFEECEDQQEGYRCICIAGYARASSHTECQPVCTPACLNGFCVRPGVCECSFGFSGSSCGVKCNCRGQSTCVSHNPNICTECMNGTEGSLCQYCRAGYVGNPTSLLEPGIRPCIPCLEICNGRSNICITNVLNVDLSNFNSNLVWSDNVDKYNVLQHGPFSKEVAICIECSTHSQGTYCEECMDGFFSLDGKCRKCACNGHGDTCDKSTGASCKCMDHTKTTNPLCDRIDNAQKTSASQYGDECWKHQCNVCVEGFTGDPANGEQCYRTLTINNEHCFDPNSQLGCGAARYLDHAQLISGKSALFALPPSYTNLDLRLRIDVTHGEVDVYVTDSSDVFDIRVNPGTGIHEIAQRPDADTLPDSTPYKSNQTRNRRSPVKTTDQIVSDTDYTNNKTSRRKRNVRMLSGSQFNNFATLRLNEVLHVTGLRDRLVVTFQHSRYTLKETKFYVVILAREISNITSANMPEGSTSVEGSGEGRIKMNLLSASGILQFRQDRTQIDLFVFFTVFFSCFFLLMSICIVSWKVKQTIDTQRARRAHHVQLQNMASRPFACAYVYLDKCRLSLSRHEQFNPVVYDELEEGESPISRQNSDTKVKVRREVGPFMLQLPRRLIQQSGVKAAISDNNVAGYRRKPVQAFTLSSGDREGINPAQSKMPFDLTQPPDEHLQSFSDSQRSSGGDNQLEEWHEAGVTHREKIMMIDGRSSDVLEHRIPLLHTTSDYLIVTSDADGSSRLTPETSAPEEDLLEVLSVRTSSHARLRQSMSIRCQPDQLEQHTGFNNAKLTRFSSTPALSKPTLLPSSSNFFSRANIRSSPHSSNKSSNPQKVEPFQPQTRTVEVGPFAFEPVEDGLAGAATFILQMPGADSMPSSLCLGTALITSKSVNLPGLQDLSAGRTRRKIALTTGL